MLLAVRCLIIDLEVGGDNRRFEHRPGEHFGVIRDGLCCILGGVKDLVSKDR